LVVAARAMNGLNVNRGTSGNLSVRLDGGFAITPSALPYESLTEDDLVVLSDDGRWSDGRRPSSEWRLHAAILTARPEVQAVVHTHPIHATAVACLRRDIPAFHYMVAVAGGDSIRCAGYARFGTDELAQLAVEALDGRLACLLANHGLVALGSTPSEALDLTVEVEALATMFLAASGAGEPALLSSAEMTQVLAAFESYRSGSELPDV
jgi:L-fuculose-phosphate aldolase